MLLGLQLHDFDYLRLEFAKGNFAVAILIRLHHHLLEECVILNNDLTHGSRVVCSSCSRHWFVVALWCTKGIRFTSAEDTLQFLNWEVVVFVLVKHCECRLDVLLLDRDVFLNRSRSELQVVNASIVISMHRVKYLVSIVNQLAQFSTQPILELLPAQKAILTSVHCQEGFLQAF